MGFVMRGKESNKKIIDGVEYTEDQYHGWSTCNKKGQYHSYNDKPAIIESDGAKFWYKNNRLHRNNDKPAIIYTNGEKHWFKNGLLHRDDDKPAIVWSGGSKQWWVNDEKQPNKYFTCFYIRRYKQYKKFFETESEAKKYESGMLAKGYCAWVIENV